MLKEIVESNVPVTQKDIDEFSARCGIDLPLSYQQFLLRNNGGQPIPAEFPIEGLFNNPKGSIQAFLGLNARIEAEDLNFLVREYREAIPQGILPIACTGAGDFLCLDLRAQAEKVVFWDFNSFWGNNVWSERSLYPVADSFSALLRIIDGSE